MNHLKDEEYPFDYIDHIREIARGVVLNEKEEVALIKLHGHDSFGDRNYYELPGGGVKSGETHEEAFIREIEEEVGYESEIIAELGEVIDFYNLIHRENHNYYYLARVKRYTGKHLEEYEKSMMEKLVWVSLPEAIKIFTDMQDYGCGRLVKNRELPILLLARQMIQH